MKKSFVFGLSLIALGGVFNWADLAAQNSSKGDNAVKAEAAATIPRKTAPKRVRCDCLDQETAVQRAAKAWLDLIDGSDYRQSWYAGSEIIRCTHAEQEWHSHLWDTRHCLGKVLSRELVESESCGNPEHMPCGDYYWLKFNTCFECCGEACEVVILRWEPDCASGCRWRVVHYDLR